MRKPKTPNQKDSMRRSAERRRCPKCQRKSALVALAGQPGSAVRRCRFCYHECGSVDGKPFGFKSEQITVRAEFAGPVLKGSIKGFVLEVEGDDEAISAALDAVAKAVGL